MRKTERKGVVSAVVVVGAGAVFVFALIASMIIPFLFLRVHLVETIVFKYKYDNAKQALQTLMSLTREAPNTYGDYGYKRASKIVGEYLTVGGNESVIVFLDAELKKMVDHEIFNCYNLTAKPTGGEKVLAEMRCGPDKHGASKYKGSILINTPYQPIELTLAVE